MPHNEAVSLICNENGNTYIHFLTVFFLIYLTREINEIKSVIFFPTQLNFLCMCTDGVALPVTNSVSDVGKLRAVMLPDWAIFRLML